MEQFHLNWPMLVLVVLGSISTVLGLSGRISMMDETSWQAQEAAIAPVVAK
jgi:hypothetical protein